MKFVVDFQAADASGALTTSLEDLIEGAPVGVQVGGRVLVDDDEGHSALATVVSILGDLVDLRIDWVSWRDRRFFASIPDRFDGMGDLRTDRNTSTTSGVETTLIESAVQ